MRFWQWWKKLWENTEEVEPPLKEIYLIYGWASLKIPALNKCPYVYVFRIQALPNGDAFPSAVRRGRSLRRFICENLLWEVPPGTFNGPNEELIRVWDQIIPSPSRLPTHRLEMGILRKGSGVPRSPFFDEYFCFLSYSGKDSDKVAIRIAGFLASQLEDTQGFEGEALKNSRAYWLAAVFAAWKRFG